MADRRIALCANRFWELVGKLESFPRSLEGSIAWALPLAIVRMPHLGFQEVNAWLAKFNISSIGNRRNQLLRACLIARAGKGIIFLNGTDSADERRFSLAHEVAHFLLDYLLPREEALRAFGYRIQDVLDGNRQPTAEERLKGVFRSIKLGTYSHLIERSADGGVVKINILHAEDSADLLALELLAPRQAVLQKLEKNNITWKDESAFQTTYLVLVNEFGLPDSVARTYGNLMVFGMRPAKTMREWLGM